MSPSGDQIFEFDPKSILSAFREMQKAMTDVEKGVAGGAERMNAAMEKFGRTVGTVNSRSQQSQERYLKSIEATSAAYGKTGVDKLIAQRDQIIKRLSTETAAVERVTAAYAKMIKIEQERGKDSGSGSSALFFRGARDLFEGRTAFAEVQIAKGLQSLSGTSLVLGGIATGIIAVGAASISAAHSVAEYGREIHDIELKTGLSADQVQRFQYAAKVTGQDIGVLDRIMRGLTTAIEGTDSKADKARATMISMGVDMRSLRDGTTSSYQLFQQLAGALEAQPNLWKRNKEAIDLFSRAGVTSLPMILEMSKSLKESNGIQFASEEQIKRFEEINHELARAGTLWDQLILQIKSGLSKPFVFVLEWALKPSTQPLTNPGADARPSRTETQMDAIRNQMILGASTTVGIVPQLNTSSLFAPSGTGQSFFADQQRLIRDRQDAAVRRFQSAQGPEFQVHEAEKALSALPSIQLGVSNRADIEAVQAAQARVTAAKEVLKIYNDQKAVVEAMRKSEVDVAERLAHPFGELPAEKQLREFSKLPHVRPEQVESERQRLAPVLADEKSQRDAKDALQVLDQQLQTSRELLHVRQQSTEITSLKELGKGATVDDVTRDIEAQFQTRIKYAREEKDFEIEAINARKVDARDKEAVLARDISLARARDAEIVAGVKADLDRARELSDLHQKDNDQRLRAANEIAKIRERDEASDIRHSADLRSKLAELTDKHRDPRRGALGEYAIRKQEADDLYNAEERRIALHETGYEAQVSHERNLKALTEDRNKAAEDAMLRLAEIQQRQFDEIKGKTEGLLHTLFTNPKGFGTQLASTLRDAALKPIESGLASTITSTIQPLVGRIGGMFGGPGRQVLIDGSGAALVRVVNMGGGSSGGGSVGTSIFNVGGYGSSGGTSTGSSSSGGFSLPGFGGGASVFGPSSITGGPGGTGGFAPGSIGLGGGGGGGGSSSSSLPGGGMLSNLKGLNLGGFTRDAGGSISGVSGLAGAGLISGGMGLAQSGLLGSHRGTFGGILMGAAGGAAIGLSLGGPWGALVGAEIGALIGIGEKIAGVETQETEAKRLVKQIYRVNIDNDTAKQIVQIAKSQYANHVSVAVRSPEVRNLVMLYSQATGQGNLLSSTVPRAGGLQEMGGQLSQTASFVNGTAYSYQSSLPIAGGFNANVWGGGSSSGPVSLQLHVAGQGAADFFAGQVVTPEFIQSGVSQAYGASNNRVGTSALLSSPGLITG